MKILTLFALSLLVACVPEQETSFNTTIGVDSGAGSAYELSEDTSKSFSYEIPLTEDSIDPFYKVIQAPKYGKLTNCNRSNKRVLNCTYIPSLNFNGVDHVVIQGQDGGIVANKEAIITFKVGSINDAPQINGSQQIQVGYNQSYIFQALSGRDIDGDTLEYVISKNPNHGTLKDCFLGKMKTCTYTPDMGFSGNDILKYKVRDPSGALSKQEATLNIVVSKSPLVPGSENFTIKGNGISRVDIVWVIDNSGSMKDEQKALQNNFASFLNGFFVNNKPRFDFNMMVTTTDAYINGKPKAMMDKNTGMLYDLSSQAALNNLNKFKMDFTKAVGVGVKGHGHEKSLASLRSNYEAHSSWFGGNDSLLVYIILSDEREQSTSMSIGDWTSYIQNLKSAPEHSKVYPIIRETHDSGKRYAQLANNFKTKISSITSPFDTILNNISADISSQTNSVILKVKGVVSQSSIKVYLNGSLVAPAEYTYNAQTKAIQFNQLLPVNASVRIDYSYRAN